MRKGASVKDGLATVIKLIWQAVDASMYRRGMGKLVQTDPPPQPEVAIPDATRHRNKWVAVKNGAVALEADTHAELVRKVRARHWAAGTYVARFVDNPPDEIVVGVG